MGSGAVIPPLPPGFTLDQPASSGSLPPLPPGFMLDQPGGGPAPQAVNPIDYEDAMFPGPSAGGGPKLAGMTLAGAGLMAAPGLIEAVPGGAALLRLAGNPYVAGGVAGAIKLATTGSPMAAAGEAFKVGSEAAAGGAVLGVLGKFMPGLSKALTARLAHTAMHAMAEAPAATEAAAPAVEAAYRGIPSLMKIGSSAPEDLAAAAEAARASRGAQGAAGMMKAAPRVITTPATMPPTGGGAAGYVQGLSEAASATPEAGAVAEDALATKLRASAMLKSNPAALANELEGKVLSLKTGMGKALSAPQLAAVIEEQYGIPAGPAEKMVNMIFQTHGLK